MNTTAKRSVCFATVFLMLLSCLSLPVHAGSPWTQETTYWGKTKGKLAFGLKNSLLGWMTPWAEAGNPKYKKQWEGFSAGMGGFVLNTTAGVVQLATFFVPVDFPDVGYGLPIPDPNRKVVMFTKRSKHPAQPEPVPAATLAEI